MKKKISPEVCSAHGCFSIWSSSSGTNSRSSFFFFKQKTAYEIRPCDWSSDVCSSDLRPPPRRRRRGGGRRDPGGSARSGGSDAQRDGRDRREIGRASCRERVYGLV